VFAGNVRVDSCGSQKVVWLSVVTEGGGRVYGKCFLPRKV
jgi:hypothetical protein